MCQVSQYGVTDKQITWFAVLVHERGARAYISGRAYITFRRL